jgi:lipopolysaccharide transport system permease protein
MRAYLASIWTCRRFWLNLVSSDLQLRYRRSLLGVGWSLLLPLCPALVLGVVFHEIFRVSLTEFLPFLLSGLSFWAFITGVMLEGCQSYVQAEPYIRQHSLPLAIYPLRTTLGVTAHFSIALVLVLAFVWLLQGTFHAWALLYLLPGLVLLFLLGWSLAILLGFVNTVFRDTQHLLQVGFQIVFYLTPIIYPAQLLAQTRVGWVVTYNPLVYLLALVRAPLLEGIAPPLKCFAVSGVLCLVLMLAALASLNFQQKKVILYL